MEMLKKALLAIAAPKHRAAADGHLGARRPGPERMGRALREYVERYPVDRLPNAGGLAATVVVTMTLETLMGGLKAAQLDTGARISPGAARRMACEAGIIPVVLGGKSEVLDVGRKRRFHTKAMRIAMALRDGGCTTEGCDWPPGLCHAHHDIPWHQGGGTSAKDGRLLCPRHHARAHDPDVHDDQAPRRQGRLHHPEIAVPTHPQHDDHLRPGPRLRLTRARQTPCWRRCTPTTYSAWPGTFR